MGCAVLAAGLVVAAIASGCAGGERHEARAPKAPADLALSHPPYMGVSCLEPNSVGCDRVGIAVWTERRAERVTATVNGVPVTLESPGEFVTGRGTGWEGYLAPARLSDATRWGVRPADKRWYGDPPAFAIVRLSAKYPDGSSASRLMRVQLMPGWG